MTSLTWACRTTRSRFRRVWLLTRGDALHTGLRDHARLARHHHARVVWIGPLRSAFSRYTLVHATCVTTTDGFFYESFVYHQETTICIVKFRDRVLNALITTFRIWFYVHRVV